MLLDMLASGLGCPPASRPCAQPHDIPGAVGALEAQLAGCGLWAADDGEGGQGAGQGQGQLLQAVGGKAWGWHAAAALAQSGEDGCGSSAVLWVCVWGEGVALHAVLGLASYVVLALHVNVATTATSCVDINA